MFNFILGLIIGGLGVWLSLKNRLDSPIKSGNDKAVINPEQTEKKQENLEKVWEMVRSRGEITNDDVEHGLGVSNATAERYLNELEKAGKLEQIGKTGKYVIYQPK